MKTQFRRPIFASLILAIPFVLVYAQQPKTDHNMSDKADEQMNKRGDRVMGFDHTKTTHHFLLQESGGSIEVTANNSDDVESRDQIRMHLKHIAMMFAEGNFNAPLLIHDQIPPGVPVMKELKGDIKYDFEEIDRGAAVRISTQNPTALKAIHDFLRFQIKEHKTGDSLDIGLASKVIDQAWTPSVPPAVAGG
jgi:hypothetical protein